MKNIVGLLLMNRKGFLVLESLIKGTHKESIAFVECRRDKNVEQDYFNEIRHLCIINKIPFFDKNSDNTVIKKDLWKIAIGWRWLIRDADKLIIIHDSLLPKYRGFTPIVNALINGEKEIGITALIASESYDRGDIILQQRMPVEYPARIFNIIEKISGLYISCTQTLLDKMIKESSFKTIKQDESEATYSVWRDDQDYFIDWSWPTDKIKRFVDAVGFPYKGAQTTLNDEIISILNCEPIPDFKAEIIHPGKVIYFDNNKPVVLCGDGAIRIDEMKFGQDYFELTKLKSRFI
jgi:methionyl-tRNA formyltransferase